MKKTLIFLIIYISQSFFSLNAQTPESDKIKFIKGLTWAQIKEKASKENRYIFLDAFTTWCIPCKRMHKEIFTQKKVGDFFNENFINVQVQMDSSKNDNDEIKRWYQDARAIYNQYNIDSYPTYLFFNPQGELVLRSLGFTANADEFIDIAASAKGAYFERKMNFERGNRDQEFLLALVKSAQLNNDRKFIPRVANAYLSTQANLLTKDNIKLFSVATNKITDPGFSTLLSNPNEIDELLGIGFSKTRSTTILFNEIAIPYLRIDASIKEYGGGMVAYGGKIRGTVDWVNLKAELDFQYPELAKSVFLMAKLHYYELFPDWNNYTKTVTENENDMDESALNRCANTVFMRCEESSEIKQALKWCDKLVKKHGQNPNYLSTYANLLYKSGQTEKAVKVYEEIIKSNGDAYGRLSKILEKMQKGEKTW